MADKTLQEPTTPRGRPGPGPGRLVRVLGPVNVRGNFENFENFENSRSKFGWKIWKFWMFLIFSKFWKILNFEKWRRNFEKIENFGKSFNQLTVETVKAFLVDSKKSNFKL